MPIFSNGSPRGLWPCRYDALSNAGDGDEEGLGALPGAHFFSSRYGFSGGSGGGGGDCMSSPATSEPVTSEPVSAAFNPFTELAAVDSPAGTHANHDDGFVAGEGPKVEM